MSINSTYIAEAPNIMERMVRFSSETGYLYGHGIVILVALVAAWRTSQYGAFAMAAYSGFWATIASVFLWLAGWETGATPVFCASFTILIILFRLWGE